MNYLEVLGYGKIAIIAIYFLTNLALLAALSVYDYKHLMLSKPLFYTYIPISLLSIYPNLLLNHMNIANVLILSVLGALISYGAFFLVAMLSKGKLGGGDVKLIPFVAFSFGPYFQTVMLFMAIGLAFIFIAALFYNIYQSSKGVRKEEYKKHKINGPYPAIPFMCFGCTVTFILLILKIFGIY